jgi:hypothetical protein
MRSWSTWLSAGFAYAVSVFTVGFALGTVRVIVLVPRFGATKSVLLEAPVILAASWLLSKVTTQRLQVPPDRASRAMMGGAAFGFLMCLELAVSLFVFKQPPSDFLFEYGTVPGMIGLAAQLSYATFPVIQARRSGGSAAIPTRPVDARIGRPS